MKKVLVALVVLVAFGCGDGDSGPSEPSCRDMAGLWNITVTNSCQVTLSGSVVVAQSGCRFSTGVPGSYGFEVTGTIDGNRAEFEIDWLSPCSGSARGTASVTASAVNGTFSGTNTGPGCCGPNLSGSFTLTR